MYYGFPKAFVCNVVHIWVLGVESSAWLWFCAKHSTGNQKMPCQSSIQVLLPDVSGCHLYISNCIISLVCHTHRFVIWLSNRVAVNQRNWKGKNIFLRSWQFFLLHTFHTEFNLYCIIYAERQILCGVQVLLHIIMLLLQRMNILSIFFCTAQLVLTTALRKK